MAEWTVRRLNCPGCGREFVVVLTGTDPTYTGHGACPCSRVYEIQLEVKEGENDEILFENLGTYEPKRFYATCCISLLGL